MEANAASTGITRHGVGCAGCQHPRRAKDYPLGPRCLWPNDTAQQPAHAGRGA